MQYTSVAQVLNSHALLLSIAIATIFASLLYFRKAVLLRRTKQWPPGPPALPIIGHLHLIGKLPHRSLFNLSQIYGPLMGLRLGAVPTIVVSSPQMAKEVLQTHDVVFASRPRLTAAVHLFFDRTDIGFAPYGPYWKLMRQLCVSELFSTKRLDTFKHVWEEEVRALTRRVLEFGGQGHTQVELRPSLQVASNNIICRMAIGKRITEVSARRSFDGESKPELLRVIDEMVELLGVVYVGDFIPWLAWLDPHGYLKRMKAAGQRGKALMQDVIEKRRESQHERQGQAAPQDLLDILLAASQDCKAHDIKITDDNIKAVLLDMFIGGSDSSALTVEWALAELISNPSVMQKVQEELDNVVGRARHVDETDIENLHYLDSVLKESMRLHPLAPCLIPRESMQECNIGGYKIPARSRAYVNTWAIGRDGDTWERPLDFWPERFDDKILDLRGQNFELLPFGSGRRKCLAWALGLRSARLMLATLMHSFTWSLESPNSPNHGSHAQVLDMSETFGLAIIMAKPLSSFITPRLPLHLY